MLSVQPTGFHHYLSLKQTVNVSNIHRYFYASWEDALWDVLVRFKVKNNATVLIPSFFCEDVLLNMRTHHLKPIYYHVDHYFQTSAASFNKVLKKHQPDIVVIFHAVGMTNSLIEQFESWKKNLPPKAILIEDCVHRVVNPKEISFVSDRHFVIDSLRKVVPLPGSNLYSKTALPLHKKTTNKTSWYDFSVVGWWLVFQLFLNIKMYTFAEQAMIRGYDVIGDSFDSGKSWSIFSLLATHIDFSKIESAKRQQVKIYQQTLASLKTSKQVFLFPLKKSDYGKLRGFPIGLQISSAQKMLDCLRSSGLLVRFELNDCPWSQTYKVIYLPLGPHLTTKDVHRVSTTLLRSIPYQRPRRILTGR